MKRRAILSVAAGGLAGIAGCSGGSGGGGTPASPTATATPRPGIPGAKGVLKLVSSDYRSEGEGEYARMFVYGTCENISDSALSYAQIEVQFLTSDNTILNNGLANVNNLSPGQRWEWEVMYPEFGASNLSRVASADIRATTIERL